MLARIICSQCGKELTIKMIVKKKSTTIITVEPCNKSTCASIKSSDKIESLEKYLCGMFHAEPLDDFLLKKDS